MDQVKHMSWKMGLLAALAILLMSGYVEAGTASATYVFTDSSGVEHPITAALTAPDVVAEGADFNVRAEGTFSKAITAWALYENATWHYTGDPQRVVWDSGTWRAGSGFYWPSTLDETFTYSRPAGTYKFTFMFGTRGFGHTGYDVAVDITVVVGASTQAVSIDAKPGSCPNGFNPKSGGVVSVAILGTADFDVDDVDPTTVKLAGVAAKRWAYEDVNAPYPDYEDECDCWEGTTDGYEDLVLKFDRKALVTALGGKDALLAKVGENVAVTLEGELTDGTAIEGSDCLYISGTGRSGK